MARKRSLFPWLGTGDERDYFIENISMLLASGTGITDALDSIRIELRSGRMKQMVDILKEDVESGNSLWRSLEQTGLFSAHTISLIRIGEESGRLTQNLAVIVASERKQREFKSKIRSALLYPGFILSVTFIFSIGVAWFILPRMATVFGQLDTQLPPLTRGLISAGLFMKFHGAQAIPLAIGGAAVLIFFLFFYSRTKFIGQSLLLRFPGTSKLVRETELARFGFILGTLLDAGVSVTDGLDSLVKASTFRAYQNFYRYLLNSIADGGSFQKSFSQYRRSRFFIPAPIQQMIIAGEQSGHLPQALITVGAMFEAKTDTTAKNLSVILEPILLVFVGAVVFLFALAVILPIYSLISGIGSPPAMRGDIPSAPPVITEPVIPEPSEPPPESTTGTLPVEPTSTVVEPVPQPLPEPAPPARRVEILPTNTGYLNVRDAPSTSGSKIGTVKPGETYEYTDAQNGWYRIVLGDGTSGWVIGTYAKPIQE